MKKLILIALSVFITAGSISAYAGKPEKWVRKLISASHPEYGDVEQAKEYYDSVASYEENKTSGKAWYAVGVYHDFMFKKQGDIDDLLQAAKAFKKALKYAEKGSTERSVKVYVDIIPLQLAQKASEAFNNSDYEFAYSGFEHSFKLQNTEAYEKPVDTAFAYNSALAAYNSKNYDKALEMFKISREWGYKEKECLNNMRILHLAKNDTTAAIEVLKETYKIDPNVDYVRELIRLYMEMGDSERAMKFVELGLEKDPQNDVFNYAKGLVFFEKKDYENAIEAFKKTLEINSENYGALVSLAQVYLDKANMFFEKSNQKGISDDEYNKFVEKNHDQLKKALNYLEKADKLKPDNIEVLRVMKEGYYKLQKEEGFKEKYDAVKTRIEELESK